MLRWFTDSDHWLWTRMGSAPPKQRTGTTAVTAVKSLLDHPLGLTFETTEGDVNFVVPGPYGR